jgi:hypothetical protein
MGGLLLFTRFTPMAPKKKITATPKLQSSVPGWLSLAGYTIWL